MHCPFLHATCQRRTGGHIGLHTLCPCVYTPSSSVYAPSPTEECMHALLSLTRPPTNLLCRQSNASMGQASYLSHRTLLTNSLMEAFP